MDIWMDAALIIALAVIIDFVIGEVPNAIHPLRWMGDILYWIDRHISRKNPTVTRLMGFLSYLFVLILFGGIAFLLSAATKSRRGSMDNSHSHIVQGDVRDIIIQKTFETDT